MVRTPCRLEHKFRIGGTRDTVKEVHEAEVKDSKNNISTHLEAVSL
jgi:hypothetical protein